MKHTVRTHTKKTTRIMALIIAMITALSAMSAFTLTASAANEEITYNVNFDLWGYSSQHVYVKINGTDGSTDWYNAGAIGYYTSSHFSFTDRNVGEIQSISIKTQLGGCLIDGPVNEFLYFNDWGFSTVKVNGVTIYGGRKITEPGEYTFSVTDNVYKVTIKTADEKKAGTDLNVNVTLNGTNGKSSKTVNTSKDGSIVLPSATPFNHHERGGTTVTMVYAPFDVLESITIKLDGGAIAAKGWLCESVTIEQMQGGTDTGVKTIEVNQWFATEEDNYERTIEIPHN